MGFDELERRGLIRKNGDFRKGSPVYAAVDCELEELPEGLGLAPIEWSGGDVSLGLGAVPA